MIASSGSFVSFSAQHFFGSVAHFFGFPASPVHMCFFPPFFLNCRKLFLVQISLFPLHFYHVQYPLAFLASHFPPEGSLILSECFQNPRLAHLVFLSYFLLYLFQKAALAF